MQTLANFIDKYGLIAMMFIIFLEYACFPVSSEIILPFSGAFACVHHVPFLVILPLSVIAGLLGTSVCYAVGRFGGNTLLDALSKRFPKSKASIDSSKQKFERYGNPAVLFGRMIPLYCFYCRCCSTATKRISYIFCYWNYTLEYRFNRSGIFNERKLESGFFIL